MGDKDSDQSEFSKLLAEECALILESDLFARAPIQSKLLSFLCAKGVEGDAIINQYVVAVDGLGRNEDYNLDSDSYPRVQMSRLRSNLASYYSSHRPASSLCVFLKPGEYILRLAPRDIAYPSFVQVNKQSENEGQSEEVSTKQTAGNQGTGEAKKISEASNLTGFSSTSKMALAGVAAAAVVLFYIMISVHPNHDEIEILSSPPTVALDVPQGGYFNLNDQNRQLAANVKRLARNQISESFVSNLAMLDTSPDSTPSYTITIDLGDGLKGPEATIFLTDRADTQLFQTTIKLTGSKERFLQRVNAAMAGLMGPNGLLAKREITKMGDEPRSAYECQLLIEDERDRGIDITDRIAECLEEYPDDKHAASWLSRNALGLFFRGIAQDIPPTKDTEGWQLLVRALAIDEYNPYANFIAAKVNVAEGNCEAAQIYLERARNRSTSYPTLIAATYAESGGCLVSLGATDNSRQEQRAEILALIDTNPMPAVPLRTNLILAGLSLGFPDLVEKAASLPVSYSSDSEDEGLADAMLLSEELQRANNDVTYFRANRQRIETQLKVYIWNTSARKQVLETLDR